jgi:putative SOS response-associated peptidase YedK
MCGRYVDFNVAPTDLVPVVRMHSGEREVPRVSWGFRTSWMTDKQKRPINARLETVATSGMWRRSFAQARCIVPALGYYEWTLTENGKQPHFISDPDAALAMAGVLGIWRDPARADDDPERWRLSMAIITRDAHVAPGEVHDRMPACLTPDAYDDWLGDHLSPDQLGTLLDQSSREVASSLSHYEVSRDVNSVRNDGPQLIQPLRPAV